MEANPQSKAANDPKKRGENFCRRSGKFCRRISPGWWFTFFALLIWAFVHGDYGVTSDEPIQSAYGELVRNFLFGNISYADFCNSPTVPDNIYFYGPALDLFCATLAHIFHADIYSVRHGVQGLMWVAMFYPVCALGRRISGRRGAWFAGLALLGMPGIFGQAFNNPKDLPLACAAIWLLHVCVSVAAGRRLNWTSALKLGVAFGFVLAMRPGAWFLGVLMGLVPLATAWRAWKFWKISGQWRLEKNFRTPPVLFFAVVIGWLLMILPWPNAWHSPLRHPWQAANLAAHFHEVYPVLLHGTIYRSDKLPWDYLATYLVLTLPAPFLVFAVWGHLVLWRKSALSISRATVVSGLIFLIWFPLTVFVALRPNIYDGMRHFLFILPPIAVLAGVAAADVAQKLRLQAARIGIALLLLSAVPAMMRLHPYEVVYYNFLAGPNATLHERYETDYWLSSYTEAAGWINKVQSQSDRPLRVLVVVGNFNDPVFTHSLNKKTEVTHAKVRDYSNSTLSPSFDYYVATARYSQWLNFSNSPVAYRIERNGILLSVIRGNPQLSNR